MKADVCGCDGSKGGNPRGMKGGRYSGWMEWKEIWYTWLDDRPAGEGGWGLSVTEDDGERGENTAVKSLPRLAPPPLPTNRRPPPSRYPSITHPLPSPKPPPPCHTADDLDDELVLLEGRVGVGGVRLQRQPELEHVLLLVLCHLVGAQGTLRGGTVGPWGTGCFLPPPPGSPTLKRSLMGPQQNSTWPGGVRVRLLFEFMSFGLSGGFNGDRGADDIDPPPGPGWVVREV